MPATEKKFNLIDEPWIKVLTSDGTEEKFGIRKLFENAHQIRALAGETPLQDTAVLRFLIAMNVTMMYRYTENGEFSELKYTDEALERFARIWKKQFFPDTFYARYLNQWHDCFWLLGGDKPFYQVPENRRKENTVKKNKKNPTGIAYLLEPYRDWDKPGWGSTAKLNGTVLESSNSPSVFCDCCGKDKETLTLDEAARWLIYYMAYAACSAKIPGKWNAGVPFTGSGATVYPVGENLFQTLMLCSVLINRNENPYKKVLPAWENDAYTWINATPYGEGHPNNLPELYTQQGRKVILHEQDGRIDGFFVAAGDRYGTTRAYVEPMFFFHETKDEKTKEPVIKPGHLPTNATAWKNFETIFTEDTDKPDTAGNPARWIGILRDKKILPEEINIPFRATDIRYGNQSSVVSSMYAGTLIINLKFFENPVEMNTAKEEIDRIKVISKSLWFFGKYIDEAYGDDGRSGFKTAKETAAQYEGQIETVFCAFLSGKSNRKALQEKEIAFAYTIENEVLSKLHTEGLSEARSSSIGKAEIAFLAGMKKIRASM